MNSDSPDLKTAIRPDFDLASATAGSFALPRGAMIEHLRGDYRAMQGMIFGDPPEFGAVLDRIGTLEACLNSGGTAR